MSKSRVMFAGSSTDAIYRAEPGRGGGGGGGAGGAGEWWRGERPRAWRLLRWAAPLAALLLALALVLYFVLADMQGATPSSGLDGNGADLRGHSWGQENDGADGHAADDVVSLDGDVILDLGDVTYHEGQFHVARGAGGGSGGEGDAAEAAGASTAPPPPPPPAPALLNDTDGALCFSPRLPLCRGVLPYDLTTLPLVPGVRRLRDLDAALPYFDMVVESGCSARARQFVCSLLEPACQPAGAGPLLPCRKACKAVAEDCSDFILATLDLSRVFQCERYPDLEDATQCVNFARGDSCLRGEFWCPDGTCVPGRWRCDGVRDCAGGADERNCASCNPDEFRCEADRKCVPARWRCDGQRDCADGSDEFGCPAREGCAPGHFQCVDQSACVPERWKCDGLTHCPDASDERNCSGLHCHAGDFQCRKTGQCIPAQWRCNGVNDCADNSDEDHCTVIHTAPRLTAMPHTSPCPAGELRCLDGRCITLQQLCDRRLDCSDGADEANCGGGD